MVMQVLGTTSNGTVQFLRNQHTGQDARKDSNAWRRQRAMQSLELHGRRTLRQMNVVHQAELAYVRSIKVDAELFTGNLDQDISILDIIA